MQSEPIGNVTGRRTKSLAGRWRALVDPFDTGLLTYRGELWRDGWFRNQKPRHPGERVEYDFDRAGLLHVPGDWNSQRPELLLYEGSVWYKRDFDWRPEPGRRLFVHFGAANYAARVWLNGESIGCHEGGFGPFACEATPRLREGANFLVVQVDNRRRVDAVPTLDSDWWNYGGLTRDVLLVDVPETFVRDYRVQLDAGPSGRVAGWLRLDGPRARQRVRVRIPEAGLETSVGTDAEGFASFACDSRLELWAPERPRLYEVEIAAETDDVRERIGFRRVETRGCDILVNGEPVFLRGVSLHEEAPTRPGRAHGPEDARALLGWARELDCNFVRLAHYPHDEHMARVADELGMLVWAEIPVYWRVAFEDPGTLECARRQLTELVRRDQNRASVILWSVGNETPPGEARLRFLAELVRTARELDPSRLVTAALEIRLLDAKSFGVDDPLAEHLDVVSFNEYLGWYLFPPEHLDTVRWHVSDAKPVIVSEFGAGALAGHHGDPGTVWTEEYQARVYEHQLRMLERIPALRGMTPWILKDFRSPKRVLPGIQDFYNRKGLLSERGQRKLAFEVLRAHYAERAGRAPGVS